MSAVGVYLPDNFEDDVVDKTKTELEMPAANDVPYSIEVDATVVCGTIYEEILKAIQVTGPDLVVMASHRPELKDYLLGPNAARVVRRANCSVLVVRDLGNCIQICGPQSAYSMAGVTPSEY